jgi:hypothetical protein
VNLENDSLGHLVSDSQHFLKSGTGSAPHVHGASDTRTRGMRSVSAARGWFERRRTNPDASEIVFAVYDSTAHAVEALCAPLTELGFESQITRVNVNTDEGVRQVPLACYRSAVSDMDEFSVYALNTDVATVATSGSMDELATRAARYLTPIYSAADVLIMCLDHDDHASEAQDLLDLAALDALLSFEHTHLGDVFILQPRTRSLRLQVEGRLNELTERFAMRVHVLETASPIDIELNKTFARIFAVLDNKLNLAESANSLGDTTNSGSIEARSSADIEIERATYEAMLVLGARRVTLIDGNSTLIQTDDALEPGFEWSALDEQVQLQSAAIPQESLCALTMKFDTVHYTINALGEDSQLFVTALWDRSIALAEVQQRSVALATTLNATFTRLRAAGAH